MDSHELLEDSLKKLRADAPAFEAKVKTFATLTSSSYVLPADSPKSTSVPAHFRPLVKVLKRQLKDGVKKVDYSMLGSLLRQESPTVYEQAGVTKLREYACLAEEAGVVVIKENKNGPGGVDGQRWVSLHYRLAKAATPAQASTQRTLDEW